MGPFWVPDIRDFESPQWKILLVMQVTCITIHELTSKMHLYPLLFTQWRRNSDSFCAIIAFRPNFGPKLPVSSPTGIELQYK